ncbi:uncharacterized protein BO72DRAFT_451456 [Aspergillus fijiensis CBS 313.89]|uniref:Uncharacterized protein n=1 Tax=Aspergillus fijiensis CBS 313.89 TaxID=1448319 RepID=A0A8G1RIV8_9EURO|nr:uncharacterized protein BO72DRAFT_451456 [Aspergillus fijiensis CBS 313.89]RAK73634.1 hypothetical protein BO72DRAFT_451456 [Aspergillus fijiensis CBS 313.89]
MPWGPDKNEIGVRQKLATKLNFLETLAMSCYVWTEPWLTPVLDSTNNKVYTELLAVDEYTADNKELENTNLATLYRDFMTARMVDMMEEGLNTANLMVQNLDTSFITAASVATGAGDDGISELTALQKAFNTLVTQFELKSTSEHVCSKSITLSWTKLDSAKRDLGDEICELPTTTTSSSSTSRATTTTTTTAAPSPDPTAQVVIALAEDASSLTPFSWQFFDVAIGATLEACDGTGEIFAPNDEDSDGYPYPDGDWTLGFNVDGMSGCSYSGTSDGPGTLTCPALSAPVQCQTAGNKDTVYCYGVDVTSITPMVVCLW